MPLKKGSSKKIISSNIKKVTPAKDEGQESDSLQNIPEQFGPDLLACKDLIELQTTLSHAITKALENLGRL